MDLKLRNVWTQVLDIDGSDLDEETNFFEAGGDSVAALRLVAAAEAMDLSLDIEDVFNNPTLGALAEKCQEAGQVSKPEDTTSEVSILDQDTVRACATACQVTPDMVEDLFPASMFQTTIHEYAKQHGTYILQWVFQICGEIDRSLLIEAWDRLQKKHQILRTRLVRRGGDLFQVVLHSDMEWQEAKDLAGYKRQSLGQHVEPGRPLFRYAVITEEDSSYFVWTAHHAGFDAWTRRMIFEHLQESLSQPLDYAQRTNGTSYKSLISYSQHRQRSVSPGYWESVLEGFNESGYVFPLSLRSIPTTTSTFATSWSRGTMKKSKFTLATIAHGAWAISLGNMSSLHDVLFSTVRSSRYYATPAVKSTFGPVVFLALVRTNFEEEQSLGDYLQSMQTQLASMSQAEHDGYRFVGELVSLPQWRQSYLSWHSHGEDVFPKDLTFKDRGGLAAKLKPRRDLSTRITSNFGLALNVFEQENSLDFYTSWDDSLRSQSDIEQLMADFVHNLDQLVGPSTLTVGDLWPGTERKWAY